MAKPKLQKSPTGKKAQPNRPVAITEEVIAQRAYALYLARGGEEGHAVEDWLRAERELQEAMNAPHSSNPL